MSVLRLIVSWAHNRSLWVKRRRTRTAPVDFYKGVFLVYTANVALLESDDVHANEEGNGEGEGRGEGETDKGRRKRGRERERESRAGR